MPIKAIGEVAAVGKVRALDNARGPNMEAIAMAMGRIRGRRKKVRKSELRAAQGDVDLELLEPAERMMPLETEVANDGLMDVKALKAMMRADTARPRPPRRAPLRFLGGRGMSGGLAHLLGRV